MTNMKLIHDAVSLVQNYLEAEGIYEQNTTIFAKALDWYNHSEITNAKMLATAVMAYGNYTQTTWDELENLTSLYFPTSVPAIFMLHHKNEDDFNFHVDEDYLAMSNYHIGEIEAAQRDAMWR